MSANSTTGGGRTVVNAGFSRAKIGRRRGREWLIVQGIVVALPVERLGDEHFRTAVRLQSPVGGWSLEGYCVAPEINGMAAKAILVDDPL